MLTKKPVLFAFATAVFVSGFVLGNVVRAQPEKKVFELRTYTAPEGKLGDLDKRFRDHTMRIFKKHGSHTAKVTK